MAGGSGGGGGGGGAGARGKFPLAGRLTADMMTAPALDDFRTSVAYPHIIDLTHSRL